MARLSGRAAALLGCLLIFAFVTACGSGSGPEPTEGTVSAGAGATSPAAAASDSLLREGTYRTPELTRKQLIAAAVKAGFTRAQAEQALARDRINQTATFTLTIEHGQWTQSFNYDRIREGVGFEATYKVIDHSTVLVTEPGATRLSSSTRWRGMPSGSVSRTPIHSSCARPTPSARWASSYGKAGRSAGYSCPCWSQAEYQN
jgi:hypothetical protein